MKQSVHRLNHLKLMWNSLQCKGLTSELELSQPLEHLYFPKGIAVLLPRYCWGIWAHNQSKYSGSHKTGFHCIFRVTILWSQVLHLKKLMARLSHVTEKVLYCFHTIFARIKNVIFVYYCHLSTPINQWARA